MRKSVHTQQNRTACQQAKPQMSPCFRRIKVSNFVKNEAKGKYSSF